MRIEDLPEHWQNRLRLDADTGCWIWSGATTAGYGKAMLGGKMDYTHRWAYRFLRGELIDSEVHHLCHVKLCCNPAHLEALTRLEHRQQHSLSGWAAVHAQQTTCVNGHPFDGHSGRQRTCSICARARNREWELRHPEIRDKRNARRRERRRERAEDGRR